MPDSFVLDPRLEQATQLLLRWQVCQLRLMDDRRFPWLVLVPERPALRDLHDLRPEDQGLVMQEITRASRILSAVTGADKMHVAALGSQVPQLHIHVIARFAKDAAWPKPVWGVGAAEPYGKEELVREAARLAEALKVK
jgi:diadenosine tetraphosphate (Ap4A) HIT family hydrolase